MWDHSQPPVGYCFTSQSYSTEQGGMIMENSTADNRQHANMHYINTAPITFIHSEFRNLTNPQMKNTPARISVWNIKWMDSAISVRSTTRRFTLHATCLLFEQPKGPRSQIHSSSFNFSDFQMLLLSLPLFGQRPWCSLPLYLVSSILLQMLLPSTSFYQIIQTSRDLPWVHRTMRTPSPSQLCNRLQGWPFNWRDGHCGFPLAFLSKPKWPLFHFDLLDFIPLSITLRLLGDCWAVVPWKTKYVLDILAVIPGFG